MKPSRGFRRKGPSKIDLAIRVVLERRYRGDEPPDVALLVRDFCRIASRTDDIVDLTFRFLRRELEDAYLDAVKPEFAALAAESDAMIQKHYPQSWRLIKQHG
jgi:hypothetical protein